MTTDESTRKVTLTFGGDAFADGRVPLTLLADKLKGLQSLLFHAAATVVHDKVARRGQWANRYRDSVELRFLDAHHSDLTIEAELIGESTPALSEAMDLGRQAVHLAYDFATTLDRGDAAGLSRLVPDRQERALLLRSIESLSPDAADSYTVTLANSSVNHQGVKLTGMSRLRARIFALDQAISEVGESREATIVGTLTKIHFDVGPQKIAVRVGPGNEIDCFYDDILRDQIANLCAGSVIEVVGIATLDVEGRVRQIDAVTGVEAVSMEPVRIARFEFGSQIYKLREAVPFNIEFSEGVWAYSNDSLGIRGFADRRDDALRELNEAFDYAYEAFARESDEALDPGAQAIKQKLVGLVESVQSQGAA